MDKEFIANLKPANYYRKSQEDSAKQILSIPSQKEEAEKLHNFWGINNSVSYQDTKTATIPGIRDGYANLRADILSKKVDSIVCWKLDRIARNMHEAGEIIHWLQSGTIKVIITPMKVYLPTENAILMAVEFGVANQFSRDLSVNVKRGQNKKARMGIPHGLASIGFTNDKTEEKGNRKWLIDEIRLPVIKEMLTMFLTGNYSGGQIYDWTLETGLTTPKHKRSGGNPVVYSRIYTILKDPIYAGFFFQNKERYELDKGLPRLITEDEHYKILRMLSGRNLPKTQTHQSIYGGFIKSPYGEFIGSDFHYQIICECKHKFSYTNKTHCPRCNKEINLIKNPKYLEYEFYYNVSLKKKRIPVKYVSQKEITNLLVDFSSKFTLSKELAKWSKKYIHELHDAEVESKLVVAESQKQRLEQLDAKKERYRNLLAERMIETKEYEQDINKINKEIENIKENSKNQENWLEKAEKIIDLGVAMKEIIKNGTIKAKREILSKLGSNLVWDEKELIVSNIKPIQVLIDGLLWAKQKNPKFEPENVIDTSNQNSIFEDIRPKLLRG